MQIELRPALVRMRCPLAKWVPIVLVKFLSFGKRQALIPWASAFFFANLVNLLWYDTSRVYSGSFTLLETLSPEEDCRRTPCGPDIPIQYEQGIGYQT